MSRIGRQIIAVPSGVSVSLHDSKVTVKGPKGELSYTLPAGITLKISDDSLALSNTLGAENNKFYGLARAIVANCVTGVNDGFTKELDIVGVGYRANLQGNSLNLQLGFSHPVVIDAPAGITFAVEKNRVTVSGIDKALVGEMAARIRAKRPPEPYKGKGIRYVDEHVRRKAGKSAVKGATK